MAHSFTKLFSSITESTVWGESHATRIVWITMLAMADRKGRIEAAIPGLANRARVTLEECEHALERFMAPDKYSRTPDNDGRRIEKINGGWQLLNYAKYREMRDHEARLEYQREWDRTHRSNPTLSDKSDQIRPGTTKAEAEADTEAEESKTKAKATSPSAPFVSFWGAWPKSERKQSRGECWEVWRKRKFDAISQTIIAHVVAMTKSDSWKEGFIPAPKVYLTQQRWEGAENEEAEAGLKVAMP